MANIDKLKAKYDALVKELVEIGKRLGATAGIMPFVKPAQNERADFDRYSKIWDELGKLRRELISN